MPEKRENPFEFRRQRLERAKAIEQRKQVMEKAMQKARLRQKIRGLADFREKNARKGGFLNVEARNEKGIFLNSVVLKTTGELQVFLIDTKGKEPLVLRQAISNLKKELKFYSRQFSRKLNAENDIILYDQPNLFVFIHKLENGRIAKTIAEKVRIFGFTEVTSYYFNAGGKLVLENARQKLEE